MSFHLSKPQQDQIGIALGAGAAKGMAHIGVLRGLQALDIHPNIVCGSSIGALVGAVYACGKLDEFHDWATGLDASAILKLLDVSFTLSGGFATAGKLIEHFRQQFGDVEIEDLPMPYTAVATDLYTGREVWLNSGNLWDAVRASIAVPGLLTPHQLKDRWLIDGGLVNPVPVSTCNALGARRVIAVNLLSDVIGKHLDKRGKEQPIEHAEQGDDSLLDALSTEIRSYADSLLPKWLRGEAEALPNMMSIVASSLDIMQDRITRSRLAGEPPDALLSPKLASISFLEFHRTGEAIAAGEKAVEDNRNLLKSLAD